MSLLERVSNAQQTYSAHDAPSHNEDTRTLEPTMQRLNALKNSAAA